MASSAVRVTVAGIEDGFAQATPVLIWAKVLNARAGAVTAFTPASLWATPFE